MALTTEQEGLQISGLCHRYDEQEVLRDIDLTIEPAEVMCLLGASGSGKSTLLRIVAGLEPLQRGELLHRGKIIASPHTETPSEHRGFGLVFQDHVLFPHMTVGDNVAFGLADLDRKERQERVDSQLRRVGLDGFADRYPHTLSGGQQQRVALARALAPKPSLLLMDEPFASVDSTLRRKLREDTRRALTASGVCAILVTHDAEEAMEIGDKIAVIDDGRIIQVGTPEQVWRQPASCFAAELLSGRDAIVGRLDKGLVATAFGPVALPAQAMAGGSTGNSCQLVFGPQAAKLRPDATSEVIVEDIRFVGDHYVVIATAGGEYLRVKSFSQPQMSIGDRVRLDFDSNMVLVYF